MKPIKSRGVIMFDDKRFRPKYTPKEMLQLGVFGGAYFRDIEKWKNTWDEFPKNWFTGLDKSQYANPTFDKTKNKYGVLSGTSLEYWREKGWIHPQDPYGWFQWYCRYYQGRRTDDDDRQIKRWMGIAGPNGRFYKRLKNMKAEGRDSPVISQLLLQWATKI